MTTVDTRTRLLDAAEKLFAAEGFHATSLRSVTAQADANLAAVSYHFGNKDGLVEAVLLRRMVPIHAARMAALDALEAEAAAEGCSPAEGSPHAEGSLPVEGVLRALLEPCVRACRDADADLVLDLVARLHSDPGPAISVIQQHFPDLVPRFLAALQRAVDGLDAPTAFWRLHFVMGGLLHALGASRGVGRAFREHFGAEHNLDVLLDQLIAFAAAGMRGDAVRPDAPAGQAASTAGLDSEAAV